MASRGGGSATSSARRHVDPWDQWTTAQNAAIDAVIGAADAREVTKAFSRIMPNFAQSRWLKSNHRLLNGTKPGGTPPHSRSVAASIAEYAAAAVPLHVSDAWSYLGRAMTAISVGSGDVARHLLYYCELRAMYALLFRHGIVLMNRSNFILNPYGTTKVDIPTDGVARNEHQAIWVLFRHWVGTSAAENFFGSIIRQRGEPLDRWMAARPLPATIGSVLIDSLRGWGMDVARFSKDRELRNDASYRPTRLKMLPPDINPQLVAELYTEVWDLLEPEPSNVFENIDRAIMHGMFATLARRDPKVRVAASYRHQYEHWVDNIVGLDGAQSLADYFDSSEADALPNILRAAGSSGSAAAGQDLTGMLGRAVLLLRFASGASRQLLAEAGCDTTDVQFWLNDLLTAHGIRPPDGSPPDYQDLHGPVAAMIEDIALLDGETAPVDLALIHEQLSEEFQVLSGFERVPAWAAAPPPPGKAVA